GEKSLAALRLPPAAGHGSPQDAAISTEEGWALREDLVRVLTYGLWRAPESVVSHVLGIVSGREDATPLLRYLRSFTELATALEVAQDDEKFAARYGDAALASLKAARKPSDPSAVTRELVACQQVLGPIARLLHGARAEGLRVIAYQDEPGADGLTRFLSRDQKAAQDDGSPAGTSGNGHAR
ncbi:MAG: hypothetical protein ACRDGS_09895, partial [Chloroflexota bacterium]